MSGESASPLLGNGASATRDDLVLVGVGGFALGVFVAAELLIAGEVGLPLDDSWIHLRFADNLAHGRGFGINPGEPVAASTAPLWTLLLAAAIALGIPGLAAAKLLGVACYLASGLLTRRLALAAGLGRPLALAAAVGTMAAGRLVWGALSGMEVALGSVLVAAGAWLAVRERGVAAAALFGLATLARPEAAVLVGLHALGARSFRGFACRLALPALLVAPAAGFSLATVGHLVPATAVAKGDGGLIGAMSGAPLQWARVGRSVTWYLAGWGLRLVQDHPALPALAVAGFWALRRTPLGPLSWVLLAHPVAASLVAPYGGAGFQTGRYTSHLLPLLMVVAASGLAGLARLPRVAAWRAPLLVLLALPLGLGLGPASVAYGWGVQNINAMQVALGRWVARHTPPEALLAVNDIGAITYFGDRRIIDLVGLATPEIIPYRREGQSAVLRYVQRVCPDYLIIFPNWIPVLAARDDLFRPLVYVQLQRREVAGGRVMVVYETVWNRWRPAPRPCPDGGGPSAPRPDLARRGPGSKRGHPGSGQSG